MSDAKIFKQLEQGPFYVDKIKDHEVYVYSHDFKHDVMMKINGDFEDEDQAIEYVKALVGVLNSAISK